jgi:hypothetical protein
VEPTDRVPPAARFHPGLDLGKEEPDDLSGRLPDEEAARGGAQAAVELAAERLGAGVGSREIGGELPVVLDQLCPEAQS